LIFNYKPTYYLGPLLIISAISMQFFTIPNLRNFNVEKIVLQIYEYAVRSGTKKTPNFYPAHLDRAYKQDHFGKPL